MPLGAGLTIGQCMADNCGMASLAAAHHWSQHRRLQLPNHAYTFCQQARFLDFAWDIYVSSAAEAVPCC